MRKFLALSATAVSVLAMTACGASGGSLDDIKVTPGKDASSKPTVEIKSPLLAEKSEATTLIEGDGAEIDEGQTVSLTSGIYKTIDGIEANSNFGQAPTEMALDDSMKEQMPELYDLLLDSKVGSWVAYSPVNGKQQADGTMAEPEEGARAEQVIVLHVEDAVKPSGALSSAEVKQLKQDKKLPTVSAKGKTPKITIPKNADAPSGLVVDVLEEGDGKKATKESTVKANYLGVRWEDGKAFDSSYERGEATEFALNKVIKGWTEGLSGLQEGSKVLLSIPADQAYGDGAGGAPAGPLVFYVEIESVK